MRRCRPHRVSKCPVSSSLLLDELLAGGVGVSSSPAAATLAVSDVEVGGAAVDVVLAERRGSGHVVRVEDVGLLASFTGESLLGETLVLHQLGVVAMFPSLRKRQRVLKHNNSLLHQLCVITVLLPHHYYINQQGREVYSVFKM